MATLAAVSLGSVFMGANTYIGNGPNFMVKAVAEHGGVEMPSFGGYVVRSLRYLVPTLLASMALFIADQPWLRVAGGLLAGALIVRALLILRKHSAANATG